jgi:hypothetical protein
MLENVKDKVTCLSTSALRECVQLGSVDAKEMNKTREGRRR